MMSRPGNLDEVFDDADFLAIALRIGGYLTLELEVLDRLETPIVQSRLGVSLVSQKGNSYPLFSYPFVQLPLQGRDYGIS